MINANNNSYATGYTTFYEKAVGSGNVSITAANFAQGPMINAMNYSCIVVTGTPVTPAGATSIRMALARVDNSNVNPNLIVSPQVNFDTASGATTPFTIVFLNAVVNPYSFATTTNTFPSTGTFINPTILSGANGAVVSLAATIQKTYYCAGFFMPPMRVLFENNGANTIAFSTLGIYGFSL
jgi:hypothetical protein